jgi:hypothetical protein
MQSLSRTLAPVASLLLLAAPLLRAQDGKPEIYGAGLFTTGKWDFFMAFTPSQDRIWFCEANDNFSEYRIWETHQVSRGRWSTPTAPGFAPGWGNADPHVSPDGKAIFFISNRATAEDNGSKPAYHIWRAAIGSDNHVAPPVRLPAPINLPGTDDFSPSVAGNGDLYFGSDRPGKHAGYNIWMARKGADGYFPPEELDDSINTAGNEVEPWVAPDGSYMIFSGTSRADSVGHYDLYVSRRVSGVWQSARPLPGGINTPKSEFNQSVSPDGRWLYFSSDRPHGGPIGERFDYPRNDFSVSGIGNGKGDIYRVAMSAVGF